MKKIVGIIAAAALAASAFAEVNIGALFTTTTWALFTLAFGKYLNYFSKYDILYGGLSSVVVLLIWLYVLSYILILGIVINTKLYNNS